MYHLAANVIIDKDDESDQEFLLDLENGTVFNLNYFAAMLIRFLEDDKTVEEYIEKVEELTEHSVDKANIEADAEAYLSQMLSMELLCEA